VSHETTSKQILNYFASLAQIRNPKAEVRKKAEVRNPNPAEDDQNGGTLEAEKWGQKNGGEGDKALR
jgi:hypothetical protein